MHDVKGACDELMIHFHRNAMKRGFDKNLLQIQCGSQRQLKEFPAR